MAPDSSRDSARPRGGPPCAQARAYTDSLMSQILPKLFLLDTFGLIFRAFYGRARARVSGLRTSSGQPTEAIYVFNNMLKRLLEEHQPDYVVAVWEGEGPTFREKEFPEYKANRDAMPEDLSAQLPYIRRLLKAWGVAVESEDGYEADDTIGLLARQAADRRVETWIVSSDKDLMQLVSDDVVMFDLMRNETYTEAEVQGKLGVPPRHVTDFLALKGDSVDNIPGAPGIGDKGAQQLIKAYGDIEGIIGHAAEVKRKTYRESLQNNAGQIRLSKRLATLDTTGSVQLDMDAVRWDSPDAEALLALYRKLEFNSLAGQLERSSGVGAPAPTVRTFESADQLSEWLGASGGPLAIAVPDTSRAKADEDANDGLGLCSEDEEAWRLPSGLLAEAGHLLGSSGRELWVHDWKSAIHFLGKAGCAIPKAADDTMLMAFLLDSSRTNNTLPKTVERRLGTAWTPDVARAAGHTRALHRMLRTQLDREGLADLYESIDLPLAPVLARMEAAGVLLDPKMLADLSARLGDRIKGFSAEIHELAGRAFNIGSPKQLGEVLYQELGLPKPAKRGKTKAPSTASDVLEGLARRHPIATKVLDWRQFTKLKNTYVDVLPQLVGEDGRLHTTFNPTGSATGRLSSLNPNLQNIPARTQLGREIRKAFVAKPGCSFVAADYSQIELRVLAHMSGDPRLVDAFRKGDDIHTRTASEVLGIDPMLITREERHKAKAVNFGIIYGLSPFGLAKQLRIPQRSAREYIALYFERYGTIKEFLEGLVEKAKESGYSHTLFGRRRPVPNLRSRNASARGLAARIAQNSPIQGTAADLIKKAMVSADASLRRRGLRSRLLLQVHDELLLEAPDCEVEKVCSLVKAEMESAADLDVPLVADVKVGPNWRDLQPIA